MFWDFNNIYCIFFCQKGKKKSIKRLITYTRFRQLSFHVNHMKETYGFFSVTSSFQKEIPYGNKFIQWLNIHSLQCVLESSEPWALHPLLSGSRAFQDILYVSPGEEFSFVPCAMCCTNASLLSGSIAGIFWLDKDLGSDIYLDGIVTLVDSFHGLSQLREQKEDESIVEAVRYVALIFPYIFLIFSFRVLKKNCWIF